MPSHKIIVCHTLSGLLSEYDRLKGLGKTVVVEGNRLKVNCRTVVELTVLDGEEKPEDRFWRAIPKAIIDWILQKSEKEGVTPSDLVIRLAEAEKSKDINRKEIHITERKALCSFLSNSRKSAGMTVASTASISGLKPSAIRIIEKGNVSFSCYSALRFLSCFGMCMALRDGEGRKLRIDSNEIIIDWLSQMTLEKGSIEKLAKSLDNSPCTFYAIFNKRSNVSIDMLIEAAKYFGFELMLMVA